MNVIYIISFILVIGFAKILFEFFKIKKSINFINEYHYKYSQLVNDYTNKNIIDSELYNWLIKYSDKAQEEVGIIGIVDYRPPFAKFMLKNYQFIINILPQLRIGKIHDHDIASLDDMLTRYSGILEERTKHIIAKIINPLIWLRQGVQQILSIPILILFWMGIIKSESKNNFIGNRIFIIISGLISFLALISSIITIIGGKHLLLDLLKKIF